MNVLASLNNLTDQFWHSAWSQNVGWTLFHSLWQITLIAALYAVAAVALRNRSASLRYLIGCVAMVAMLIVPAVTFYVLATPESANVAIVLRPKIQTKLDVPIELLPTADQVNLNVAAEPITPNQFAMESETQTNKTLSGKRLPLLERMKFFVRPWLPIATVVWLSGVLLLSMRLLLGCIVVQKLRLSGLSPLAESHSRLANRIIDRLGVSQIVQFAQSSLVEVPTLIGYLRPMVLLPVSTVTGLTTPELELILAHELAHIRRHDYALNLVQAVIEALLFYHPGMWWVSSHVRHERENCCDDIAVATSGNLATYVRALARLEEHRIAPPSLSATGGSLLMRVQRLLDQPQSEFGYRRSSIWLSALILGFSLTIAALAGPLSGDSSVRSEERLSELTSVQNDKIVDWAKQVHDGQLAQAEFTSRTIKIGPASVRALVAAMDNGRGDEAAMVAFSKFIDQPLVQAYLESVLDELPADPNRPCNLSHHCLSLMQKYAHNPQSGLSETKRIALCVKFLKVNPSVAANTLGAIGGREACEQLVAAFAYLPKEGWGSIPPNLARVSDPIAVLELKRRLREIEQPLGLVAIFTDAIYTLSGGDAQINTQFLQGQNFAYPYNKGGIPKSFSVNPVKQFYIRLPKVDTSTEEGQSEIWKTFGKQTSGPGFTIDRGEIVLLNGLRAIAVNADGMPSSRNLDKWICETPAAKFVDDFAKPGTTDRVKIPSDGLLLAMDPQQTVYLLRLRKKKDSYQYNVYFARSLPLKNPHISDKVSVETDFGRQVGQTVARIIRANLPFVDEQRLTNIEGDFAQFVSSLVLSSESIDGRLIDADQRKAILAAIKNYGAQHLAVDRYRKDDFRSISLVYLWLPDRLLTLKWKLHQAIAHAATLDEEARAKLTGQRTWMQSHIQSLPDSKYFTHQQARALLNERFADPLCCTLGYPMDDERFALFQQQLKEYKSQTGELGHVVSHIVQQSLNAKYQDIDEFQLPFGDRVISYGAGAMVHLGFESNREFVNSEKNIYDIKNSRTVIDASTGHLAKAPKDARDEKRFLEWITDQKAGDVGFDDARGGRFVAIRGAKLAKLDVRTWPEADAIANDELRALLEKSTPENTVSLKQYYLNYQQNNIKPNCYVGVLTKEGQLAVISLEDFDARNRISVRTRVRPEIFK